MSDLKENIIQSIKDLLLPEIKKLQEGQNEIRIRQESLEKQLMIMNENILGNSRRIDETNRRIDDTNKRFDDVNKRFDDVNKRFDDVSRRFDDVSKRFDDMNMRIDNIYIELGNIKKEMERLKRDDVVTGDILHRMEILEEKVLLGR